MPMISHHFKFFHFKDEDMKIRHHSLPSFSCALSLVSESQVSDIGYPLMEEQKSNIKLTDIDAPLHAVGFEFDESSPHRVTGRLLIKSIHFLFSDPISLGQSFYLLNIILCHLFVKITNRHLGGIRFLHGGASAMIAEGLASNGAHIACGFEWIAGIQLSSNHMRPAELGDLIYAEATPVVLGKTIQVWEVRLLKNHPSNSQKKIMVSSSRLTLVCNMPVPERAKAFVEKVRMYAKL